MNTQGYSAWPPAGIWVPLDSLKVAARLYRRLSLPGGSVAKPKIATDCQKRRAAWGGKPPDAGAAWRPQRDRESGRSGSARRDEGS